jgi:glycine/D-amino acid oxidase-like deaminating enzyme
MYARLSPDSALALYALITYMDTIEGVWFPEGGIRAVPMIMAQVAEKARATFRYGDPVAAVLRSPIGQVAGVCTASGERIMADAVVCLLIFQPPMNSSSVIFVRHEPWAAANIRSRPWSGMSGYAASQRLRPPITTFTSAKRGMSPSMRCLIRAGSCRTPRGL